MRIRGLVSAMTEFFFFQRYDTRGLVNAVRITEHTECSTTKQLVSARKIYSMQYHSMKNIQYTESVNPVYTNTASAPLRPLKLLPTL